MKRILLNCFFLLLVVGLSAQNFQPQAGVYYNITQLSSQLVIGAQETQPVVQTLTNHRSQAFQFIPVTGNPGVYYMRNMAGMYLNKMSGESWNYWTSIFEDRANGAFSEWMIEGAEASEIRLKLMENNLYLASDNTTENSHLYVDKSSTHANGLYKIEVSAAEPTPIFTMFERNLVIEIEDIRPYPFRIRAEDFLDNIEVEISAGFEVLNPIYTPQDFVDAGGTAYVEIVVDGAQVGDTGKMVFSYTKLGVKYLLDSVYITPVPDYKRYHIVHASSGLVIGKQSTSFFPALVENTFDETQQFILREVNPGANDNMYYLVQDGEYRMLRKVITSNWNTEYGYSGDEAKWTITEMPNGTVSLTNYVTQRVLGTDSDSPDSRIYCDKVYSAGSRMEWIIEEAVGLDEETSMLRNVVLSAGLLETVFDPEVKSYNVLVPADAEEVTITASPRSALMDMTGSPAVITPANPTATITGISGNAQNQTAYDFSWKPIVFSQWDAEGSKLAARSVPSQWGWRSSTTASWAAANATTAGTMRYIDNPANYKYNGEEGWTGRILYLRWDGSVTVDGVFSFPVTLEGGKKYNFSGKYAWNSVVPDGIESAMFIIGINSAPDNSGASVASEFFIAEAAELLNLRDASFEFTAPVSGVYYLTIANNTALLAAVADLKIESPTSIDQTRNNSIFVTVSDNQLIVVGTQPNELVRVYNMSGQLVKQQTATSDQTNINLSTGVYLIRVNNQVLKVVK